MIHSSHRDRKTKAIAEALAMIPDVHPELVPHRPRVMNILGVKLLIAAIQT